MSPDFINTLGFAMGSAWLSGINLYATVVMLGLLPRFHLVQLPGSLDALLHWWFVGLAGFLYIVEFAADKIPAVDSIWDAKHTFIRIPAGAVNGGFRNRARRVFTHGVPSGGDPDDRQDFLVFAVWLARRSGRALRRLFQPRMRVAGSP
jgi:hypothetical protein